MRPHKVIGVSKRNGGVIAVMWFSGREYKDHVLCYLHGDMQSASDVLYEHRFARTVAVKRNMYNKKGYILRETQRATMHGYIQGVCDALDLPTIVAHHKSLDAEVRAANPLILKITPQYFGHENVDGIVEAIQLAIFGQLKHRELSTKND